MEFSDRNLILKFKSSKFKPGQMERTLHLNRFYQVTLWKNISFQENSMAKEFPVLERMLNSFLSFIFYEFFMNTIVGKGNKTDLRFVVKDFPLYVSSGIS